MKIETVKLEFPEGTNIIFGQSHFVKTVEDLHEAMVNSVPGAKFGVAFSEASIQRLVRQSGTDVELCKIAGENLLRVGCGHCFLIIMRDCYPINVLHAVKNTYEVVNIFCATANPVDVVVVREENRGAVLGVFDGFSPVGIEDEKGIEWRKDWIRKFGYKL